MASQGGCLRSQAIQKKDGWALHPTATSKAIQTACGRSKIFPDTHNYWAAETAGILGNVFVLTFQERVATVARFVEVLDFAHAHAGRIRTIADDADARSIVGQHVSVRSRVKIGGEGGDPHGRDCRRNQSVQRRTDAPAAGRPQARADVAGTRSNPPNPNGSRRLRAGVTRIRRRALAIHEFVWSN
jgi:hypothetical protein